MSEKQGLPVDNSASPQTIPPAALRDIPGALSFSTLLPKSSGQLLHPLRKVLQAFSFPEVCRYEVPEQNSRKATQARQKSTSQDKSPQAAPICAYAHLIH